MIIILLSYISSRPQGSLSAIRLAHLPEKTWIGFPSSTKRLSSTLKLPLAASWLALTTVRNASAVHARTEVDMVAKLAGKLTALGCPIDLALAHERMFTSQISDSDILHDIP